MTRLSLRSTTIISVALIGVSFILLSLLAGNYFRRAALDAQVTSLSRIIEVASHQIFRSLQRHALSLSASINTDNHLSKALQQADSKETITAILDDPFVTGFVGAADVELAKIRIYDLALQPLFQSSRGNTTLPPTLPPHLYATATARSATERLKALSELWVSPSGPLYSVLLPIGGLHIVGYIEIVFDPHYTLQGVSEITRMPISIHLPQEENPPIAQTDEQKVLPIEYTLLSSDGLEAYHMVGSENIEKLNQDMLRTQWFVVSGFLALIFAILLLALWLLRLAMFNPLRHLMQGIDAYSHGELDTHIKTGGLAEIYILGQTFNEMLQRIRNDIKELEKFSTTDSLTGIHNRRYFDNCIAHEVSHARRLASPLSLLYIDIDYFKLYNDHYGHLSGDETLQQVAKTVQTMARRETDVAARLGGEEFAILLPDTELENARAIAEALRLAVNSQEIPHCKSEVAGHITLSIGIASMIPEKTESATDLIKQADKALYRAKAEGRDRVVVSAKDSTSA